jgi:hypothetical protein
MENNAEERRRVKVEKTRQDEQLMLEKLALNYSKRRRPERKTSELQSSN